MIKLWAGTDISSYHLVAQAQEKLDTLMASQAAAGAKAGWIDDMIAELPPIWRHHGSTAIVEVNGPLVSGDAGFLRLFGVMGYDNFLSAAIEAAAHENTKALMFRIETPGGDVTGLVEACDELSKITAMMPSATHTGEQMCSAGYWLASAVKENYITAGPTAQVGSIGILRIHSESSKRMEDAGIKTTVLRSGKFKAEVNSIEPLTDGAKGRAEDQLADVHGMFRAQVRKGRPNLSAEDLAEVTEGQVFLGARAVKAGLADKILSFDLALNLLDKRKHSRDTSSKSKGKTMAIQLTPEQLRAISKGAPMQSFGLNDDGTEMTAGEIEAYAAKVREDAAAKLAKEADDARIAAENKDKANQPQAPPDGVVALLTEQLATANAKITEMSIAAVANTAKAAAHDGLLAIARTACAKMLIPMGGTRAAVDGMDAAAVIAEHARVEPLFLAKFPGGRQSLPSHEDQGDDKNKANVLPAGFAYALQNAPTAKR